MPAWILQVVAMVNSALRGTDDVGCINCVAMCLAEVYIVSDANIQWKLSQK